MLVLLGAWGEGQLGRRPNKGVLTARTDGSHGNCVQWKRPGVGAKTLGQSGLVKPSGKHRSGEEPWEPPLIKLQLTPGLANGVVTGRRVQVPGLRSMLSLEDKHHKAPSASWSEMRWPVAPKCHQDPRCSAGSNKLQTQ